jgi:hypothetical protein
MIADAAHIVRKKLPEGAREWLNARARVICIASTLETPQRHIIIAGSDDVKNPDRFLQVMSWDGKMFYYYAVSGLCLTDGVTCLPTIPRGSRWRSRYEMAFKTQADEAPNHAGGGHQRRGSLGSLGEFPLNPRREPHARAPKRPQQQAD